MGGFSVFMTFILGIKFIVRPVMTTKEAMAGVSAKKRALQSVICGVLIGFICGFIGAGGGMMMLLILTSVLGYELKTAVGTSVFIMAFTAFTGAASHFAIGGIPDVKVWILCLCLMHCVYINLGKNCRCLCKQGHSENTKSCNRYYTCCAWNCSNGILFF